MTKKKDITSTGFWCKKFTGFNNWPRWSDLTRAILVEKNIGNFIETGPRPAPAGIWKQKIKKNRIEVRIVTQIIKEDVSNDIFNIIINITDPKEIWEKLYAIYFQVD